MPSSRPAPSSSRHVSGGGLGREATTANRVAEGRTSRSSSTYFWPSPGTKLVSPVMLPPGRERLATNPCATGSGTTVMTIGIKAVARFAATVSRGPVVTMASTFARTSSATRAGRRSGLPSAKAGRMTRFRPST